MTSFCLFLFHLKKEEPARTMLRLVREDFSVWQCYVPCCSKPWAREYDLSVSLTWARALPHTHTHVKDICVRPVGTPPESPRHLVGLLALKVVKRLVAAYLPLYHFKKTSIFLWLCFPLSSIITIQYSPLSVPNRLSPFLQFFIFYLLSKFFVL